ncbi:sugar transferase [Leisingera sp. D0M16]|uniref:sugar transferase n=1 Tax=Leisingera coralii TaxID=3351347 RepID=UPI003B7B0CEA
MQDFSFSAQAIENGITRETSGLAASGFYAVAGKRAFDITLALVLLPVIAPIILVLWFIVRHDGGPGFFGHTRVGQKGEPFKCWKIRSMVADAESRLQAYLDDNPEAAAEWERDHKLTNDPRINRLGHFLRETSLDELPQILNVLKGEMSFVGPRPIVAKELTKYGESVAAYLVQKPGITGPWQISGRNDISYDQRVALDVTYLSRRSFLCDLKIILMTASAILGRTGR